MLILYLLIFDKFWKLHCFTNDRHNAVPYGESYFGQGIGKILFGQLSCNGYEMDLIHCSHSLSASKCAHNEDAGVRCSKKTSTDGL